MLRTRFGFLLRQSFSWESQLSPKKPKSWLKCPAFCLHLSGWLAVQHGDTVLKTKAGENRSRFSRMGTKVRFASSASQPERTRNRASRCNPKEHRSVVRLDTSRSKVRYGRPCC